jgi:N6-adenosine-specific RNA methylase IME4
MKTEDICKLPIKYITDDDCVLFLWCIFNKLQDALDVIKAWGFEYKSCAFVWIKRNGASNSFFWGMGGWTRQNAECCLLGIKGNPKHNRHDIHSVVEAKIRDHSQKPAIVYERIENLVGDMTKIELFAREKREGWDAWGNQVPNHCQKLLTKEDA